MTFNELLIAKLGKHIPLLEIETSTATYRFSTTAIRETEAHWQPRLKSVGQFRSAIHPTGDGFTLDNCAIELDNSDGHFANLNYSAIFKNATATLYHGIYYEGVLYKEQRFTGVIEKPRFTTMSYTFSVVPKFRLTLGNLQRPVTDTAFPNATDETLGSYQTIASGQFNASHGAVKMILTDNSGSNKKFSLCQGRADSIDEVWRKRGDVYTQLTVTAHYTVNTSATDGDGNSYTQVTILAAQYQDGDQFFANLTGLTGGETYQNVAANLREIITGFSGFSESDLDGDLWDAAELFCQEHGYVIELPNVHAPGILIPKSPGQLEGSDNQFDVLNKIAAGFGHCLFITPAGKLGITSIDLRQMPESVEVHFDKSDLATEIEIDYEPLTITNKCLGRFGPNHQSDSLFGSTINASNSESQAAYGLREGEFDNRAISINSGNAIGDPANDIMDLSMRTLSGGAQKASFTVNGMHGLRVNPGDVVEISSDRALGAWDRKRCLVTAITPDYSRNQVKLEVYPLGPSYWLGATNFGELELVLSPTKSQDFDSGQPATNLDNEFLSYGIGVETGTARFAIGYELPTAVLTGKTWQVTNGYFSYFAGAEIGGESHQQLRIMNNSDFLETGTWNNIDGLGNAWNDATNIGIALTDVLDESGHSSNDRWTMDFNTTGIAALQSLIDAEATDFAVSFNPVMDTYGGAFIGGQDANPVEQPRIVLMLKEI